MNFFDKIYKQVFKYENTITYNGKKQILSESYHLEHSKEEAYEYWKGEEDTLAFFGEFWENLLSELKAKSLNQRYSIYESPQSNGFYVLCENYLNAKESAFVMEYMKDKVIELGYLLNHSYRDIYEEKGTLKTKVSYYLKPKLENFKMPLDQKFGNIHLEHLSITDKPDYIKLMANVYSDRNYTVARGFDELLNALNT